MYVKKKKTNKKKLKRATIVNTKDASFILTKVPRIY